MKNLECKYRHVCKINTECYKCDLKNHKKAIDIIIRQLRMDAKQKESKIKIDI